MVQSFSLVVSLACLVLCGAAWSSVTDLWAIRAAESVREKSLLYPRKQAGPVLLSEVQGSTELTRARSAVAVPMARAEGFVHLARVLDTLAISDPDAGRKIGHLCGALSSLGAAVTREPRNAAYLINWANVRQLLGSARCSEPYTEAAFEPIVRLALDSDPTDVRVLYAGALVYHWSNRAVEAKDLLRRMLLLGARLSPGQEKFVYSMLLTPADVESVIPARFPQVREWSSAFRQIDPRRYREFRPIFGTLEARALKAGSDEFERGLIPAQVHEDRLLSLFGNESSEESRRELDARLSRFAATKRQDDASQYLARRAALRELEVLRASMEGDTRPLRTSLFGWGRDSALAFDEFFQTVGFYLPEGQELGLIQLASALPGRPLMRADVRVMGSGDNENWVDLSDECEVRSFLLASRPILVLQPKHSNFKYWKVQFSNPERRGSFRNDLSRLVRVFGASRLQEGAAR